METIKTDSSTVAMGRYKGPPLWLLAIIFVTLFVASMILTMVLTNGASYPIPYGPAEDSRNYYIHFANAIRISAFLQFGASIPLGLFTATVVYRLRYLKIDVAGLNIAFFGGMAASVFMGLSALMGWVQSQPGISSDLSTMRAVQLMGFAFGGVGHIVALGLLLAGVSVPSLFGKLLPRWLCWMGLIIAAIAELTVLTIVWPQLSILLPVARFTSFIWFICTGFLLMKARPQ